MEILETSPIEYRCYCSRERMERALLSIGREERRALIDEKGEAELTCRFCDNVQHFSRQDLEAMLADAEAAGCKLYLVSGYRSVERQTALFKRKTNSFMAEGFSREEAEKQAAMWVARPGTSEHNTGLAADIVSADWYSKHSDLTADFEDTPEFEWLNAHCADYGLILRYPRGKENVTGVTYEPWHYRYVGKNAALEIYQQDITLEEYLEQK